MNIKKYHCNYCKKDYPSYQVRQLRYVCPNCNQPLELEVAGTKFSYICKCIPIENLCINNLVVFDPLTDFIPMVLNITKNGNKFRVALKNYGTKEYQKGEYVIIIA